LCTRSVIFIYADKTHTYTQREKLHENNKQQNVNDNSLYDNSITDVTTQLVDTVIMLTVRVHTIIKSAKTVSYYEHRKITYTAQFALGLLE